MAKRRVVDLKDGGWWVWLLGRPAIKVKTEAEARDVMIRSYHDEPDLDHLESFASTVVLVLWSDPLPEGEDHHKSVILDINLVCHRGVIRKTVPDFPKGMLAKLSKGWEFDEGDMDAGHPLSWPEQHRAALADPEVLLIRKLRRQGKTILDQLDERWPKS